MNIKTPKVLEKTPVVAGFTMDKVGVAVISFLGFFLSLGFSTVVAILFLLIGGAYFYFYKLFPAKGEFYQFIAFLTGKKCIVCNASIENLTRKKRKPMKKKR